MCKKDIAEQLNISMPYYRKIEYDGIKTLARYISKLNRKNIRETKIYLYSNVVPLKEEHKDYIWEKNIELLF